MKKQRLETQPYLLSPYLSKSDSQLIFSLRCRNLDVKTNFKILYNNDLSCKNCCESNITENNLNITENEQHILECEGLVSENDDPSVKYDVIFSDIHSQIRAMFSRKCKEKGRF